jgi:hypothetical protein
LKQKINKEADKGEKKGITLEEMRSIHPSTQHSYGEGFLQAFLLALPMGLSSLSNTMQTSSIRRTCSSSYPASSLLFAAAGLLAVGRTSRAKDVSTSGKRVATFSAVIVGGAVIVVVALIVAARE